MHILCSNGSHKSYISDKLRKQNVKVKTSGKNTFHPSTVDVASLVLIGNEKLLKIEAICNPIICSDIMLLTIMII